MNNLRRVSIFYLLLPFILFCLGWLRLWFSIPIVLFSLFAIWRLFRTPRADSQQPQINYSTLLPALFISGVWLFFSGIGGYAFQNWDHNWRNAVFRDLINFDLPVYYSMPAKGPIKMLVYYVGAWLPAVWAGKFFGWQAANFALFLWNWLGLLLIIFQLGDLFKTSAVKSALLLIFFSGMDALGVLFFSRAYPTLFPPFTHLELWNESLQYSSLTTQLFWVFNQAVPSWLCLTLIASDAENVRQDIHWLIWALCFFSAPLVAIGMFPYLLINFFKHKDWRAALKNIRLDILLTGGLILLISFFYFSANTAAQERGFQNMPLGTLLIFFLLEGGALWLLLVSKVKLRDPVWALTGVLLFALPLVKLGHGQDFAMRASIAPLFYLMMLAGKALFNQQTPRPLRLLICLTLLIGALTPLYEINRSAYRTYQYYFVLDETQRAAPSFERVTHLEPAVAPEDEHPNSLTADGIPTLQFMTDELSKNFIANVRGTFFFKYLASH